MFFQPDPRSCALSAETGKAGRWGRPASCKPAGVRFEALGLWEGASTSGIGAANGLWETVGVCRACSTSAACQSMPSNEMNVLNDENLDEAANNNNCANAYLDNTTLKKARRSLRGDVRKCIASKKLRVGFECDCSPLEKSGPPGTDKPRGRRRSLAPAARYNWYLKEDDRPKPESH